MHANNLLVQLCDVVTLYNIMRLTFSFSISTCLRMLHVQWQGTVKTSIGFYMTLFCNLPLYSKGRRKTTQQQIEFEPSVSGSEIQRRC